MTFDRGKFINPQQVGGIDSYVIADGEGRGVRVFDVNTGGGLRYRVLADRGLDIDRAAMRGHNLAFLTHRGTTAPTRALDRDADWLRGFGGGLLCSCGPFNAGAPADDNGERVGLHGTHSNTAAEIESVVQPDPHAGRLEMAITGTVRYGAFYGPNLTLRRTIRSTLGSAAIQIEDAFTNPGNTPVPHAWLLHINFGYPLLDEGAEFLFDADPGDPRADGVSPAYFADAAASAKTWPPAAAHRGDGHVFRYITPRPDAAGQAHVAIWNERLRLGLAIGYSVADFPRLGQWLHWGEREYVAALEPMTGGVEGRDIDRQRGWLRTIEPGETRAYRYSLSAIEQR